MNSVLGTIVLHGRLAMRELRLAAAWEAAMAFRS
jgi:hypothetical protein